MTQVINLFGAPSTGKSTFRAGIFHYLKINGYSVEEVTEYAKDLVWDQHQAMLEDQLYIFAVQNRRQQRLIDKVDFVVTDSPILLNNWYYVHHVKHPLDSMLQLMEDVWNSYENINILLEREHKFEENGRFHNEEEATIIQQGIKQMLDDGDVPYITWRSSNLDIKELINKTLDCDLELP